jgi:hypothetical protein
LESIWQRQFNFILKLTLKGTTCQCERGKICLGTGANRVLKAFVPINIEGNKLANVKVEKYALVPEQTVCSKPLERSSMYQLDKVLPFMTG